MGTEVSRVTLESKQQPWHPAWSRQWIPQSNKQNDANPQKPQTIGNVLAPQDENRMRFTFTQLAGGAKVTFLNPSLALSKKVERESPSPRRNDCKKMKRLDGTTKVTKWELQLLMPQNTWEGVVFQKWGGRQMLSDALKTRQEGELYPWHILQ